MGKDYSVNNQIKANKVRLILSDGEMGGVVPLTEALKIAQVDGLDLVEVSIGPDDFPVCKVLDYGKMMYERKKREKTNRKVQHTKEIKHSFNITDHDLAVKHKKVREFLKKHYVVRYAMELKGRERDMINEALIKVNEQLEEFSGLASWSTPSISRGSRISISTVLKPM